MLGVGAEFKFGRDCPQFVLSSYGSYSCQVLLPWQIHEGKINLTVFHWKFFVVMLCGSRSAGQILGPGVGCYTRTESVVSVLVLGLT